MNDPKSILCVDDDPDDLILIRNSINKLSDVNIESARNGKLALAILVKRKVSKSLPSLIVMDINMPILDGNKMLKAIKEDDDLKNIPIVVFTTMAKTTNLQYVKSQKIETIAKPTDWDSYEAVAKKIPGYLSKSPDMNEALCNLKKSAMN